jgi:polysaccharide deacetylase family protein (PEP-CTERM system associated)
VTGRILNAMTVDLEEYFHPSEVMGAVDPASWPTLPSRLGVQTEIILDLFAEHKVTATFFVLGWAAQRHPSLIRRIAEHGHEIACHSWAHRLVYGMTPADFRADTLRAVSAISDACGIRPLAYRAPSYSITAQSMWALEILAECGFRADSSIYPIQHDRYGVPGFGRHAVRVQTPSGPIEEIPPATVQLGSQVVPVGGGGYLRLLPCRYTIAGVRRVNEAERRPVCLYFHPWEIDPDQPRIARGAVARLRTYMGLSGMRGKLDRLLREFRFSTLSDAFTVRESVKAAS